MKQPVNTCTKERKKRHFLMFAILLSVGLFFLTANAQIKVACIGASITEGARIKNPKENAYPGQLQSLLGPNYTVENYGVGGSTMLKKGNFPYWKTEACQKALKSNPDIVFIDLGGNDAKAVNRPFYNELEQDCREMIRSFKNLPSHPRVIVLLPTAFFVSDKEGIYDPISKGEVAPRLQKAAYEEDVEVLNMHPLLSDRPDLIPDKIHPEEQGSSIIAKRLFTQIGLRTEDAFDLFKHFDRKGINYKISHFSGYKCATFQYNNREYKVVKPKKTAANHPWIRQTRLEAHELQTYIALLERGYHFVYCDQAERTGDKQGAEEWNAFHKLLHEVGLNDNVVLEDVEHHLHNSPNPASIVDFIEEAINKGNAYLSSKYYDSYKGLAMAGYQGWFSCPGDGSDRNWYHFSGKDGLFEPGICSIDMWPDVSEYDKTYRTSFVFADGRPAYVMSEYDESTVETHFRWMREYNIDGVFVQRFVAEIKRPKSYRQLNKVWHSALNAANANNRAISIMYDLSGMLPGDEAWVLSDIDSITSKYDIKERINNPSYIHHNGKPLVAVWGVGFNDRRRYGIKESESIIDALIERGFSVLIGVPTHWRELNSDTMNDPELHRLIKKCDIVMPWFVGRYNENSFAPFEKLVAEDIAWCKQNKVDYAPLAFPGFSWINMNKNSKPIPRNRGSFYWKQLSSHINNGAEMLYLAMFDEIDEGTAIFKCATEVPNGESYFLPLDADLGNDYYLYLAGQASKALKSNLSKLDTKIPQRENNFDQKRQSHP
ncbi:MAG: GDSL-type esterase/lipase family protein [Tannerella sp.]|jgi:lysophospholipase L1-like esterase|nr:GDSL-type esterase/lipase family protein [Tannerella sp.]